MIWSKRLGGLVLAAMAVAPLQAALAQQRPAHPDKKTAPTVVVWIREVHHRALYWLVADRSGVRLCQESSPQPNH